MADSNEYGKTMLEVSKELGVSKDVVKYHQRKMDFSETFRENGKIYITPTGVEKIKAGLRKDKELALSMRVLLILSATITKEKSGFRCWACVGPRNF
ncbi:Uncharacterised protein [Chlamydia trachomatis]|nr:Uncharacterised protein [Chlamydia trachomatis]CRH91921.1 Uncharacterised protein [Chlamydia trachomatis]